MEKSELKNFIYVSLISADNDELEEDVKQEIMSRYNINSEEQDWKYVLEPIRDEKVRDKIIMLFEECER